MGKTVRNEVTEFPDGSKFISFKHEGGFETGFKFGAEVSAFGAATLSKEANAKQFQKWTREENNITEKIDELTINNTEGDALGVQ